MDLMPREVRRQVSKTTKAKVRARDNDICQYCGLPGYEVDHIVPMAWTRVGTNQLDNLVCCCRRCNGLLGSQVFDGPDAKKQFIRDKLWPVEWLGLEKVRQRVLRPRPSNPDPLGVWPRSQGHVMVAKLTPKRALYAKGYARTIRARLSRPKPPT